MIDWPWHGIVASVLLIGILVFAFGELGWGGGEKKNSVANDSTGPF